METLAMTRHPASDTSKKLPAITDAGSEFKNFLDTARAVTEAHQVVTVDTAMAHLAGALGLPTLVLIPDPPDWRWGVNLSLNPWYRKTRLIYIKQRLKYI
jgi:ADP-heptose:LPS heptosyltransferase